MDNVVPKWAASISRLHGLGMLGVDAYEHHRAGAPSIAFCRRMKRVERRAKAKALCRVAALARQLRMTVARFCHRGATDAVMAAWERRWPERRASIAVDESRLHDDDRRVEFLLDIIERALADLRADRAGR